MDYLVTDPVTRAKQDIPAHEDTKLIAFTNRINPKIQGVFNALPGKLAYRGISHVFD